MSCPPNGGRRARRSRPRARCARDEARRGRAGDPLTRVSPPPLLAARVHQRDRTAADRRRRCACHTDAHGRDRARMDGGRRARREPDGAAARAQPAARRLEDWSTPGGVIDDRRRSSARRPDPRGRGGDRAASSREWEGPLYEVDAVAPDLGWVMRCEVHRAVAFEGELRVDDPDGIVVEAAFVPPTECADRLGAASVGARAARGVARRAVGAAAAARASATRCAAPTRADLEVDATPSHRPCATRRDHPPRRPRRVLRVGRAARRPVAARQAGHRRRARQPRRRRRRELRGARVRRALGDADGAGPAGVPARGVPRAALRRATRRRAAR